MPPAESSQATLARAARLPLGVIGSLVISLLLAPAASAEERKHSWEFGGYLGYTFLGNELKVDDNLHYGLRVGWYMTPVYEMEVQWTRGDQTSIGDLGSTLIANDSVFLLAPEEDWTFDSLALRFVINPHNERRRLKPFGQIGLGTLSWTSNPALVSSDQGDVDSWLVTAGGGVRYRLSAHTQLRAELEDQYSVAEVYSNVLVNVGLTWVFGGGRPPDSDGDGVLDLDDRCPDTPKGSLVDKHDGCPWDIDRDGVMEGLDQCANTPQGWPVDEKGCPLESDGDAVPDGLDKCADTPKGAIVDATGCPSDSDKDNIFDGIDRCPGTPAGALVDGPDSPTAGCAHDTDNDGVVDGVDQCALTPAGASVDEKGCPKDSDGDRVLDGLDQCPDTPRAQKIDKEGCPRIRLDKTEPQVLQNVKFHGMELYPGSEGWLALLVDAATYWEDVVFEVGIYTDNEGGAAANRTAAQRRSEVLKGWLVQQGIPASRFVMKAYGPVNFIADNNTEEGRDKNRRVEVKRLSGDVRRHPKPAPEPEAPPAQETPPAQPTPPPSATPPAPSGEAPPAATPGEGAAPEPAPKPPEEPKPSEEPKPPEEPKPEPPPAQQEPPPKPQEPPPAPGGARP
ncbi:MAG TPA: OmpA family protein [Candidatus Cryosericum sp.]|nr:OmpA family protein [Candidatus Cryosericum sp.]